MLINATLINLYHVCHRELWLHAHSIRMEHTSDIVAEGKLIGEISYPERASKFTEIEIDGVKIDFFDAHNKVVHEVKKSSSVEQAHIAQVKYYIYKLTNKGIENVTGIIEYPKLKKREEVYLLPEEHQLIQQWERNIECIISNDQCPEVIHSKICRSCSYFDFCYSSEPSIQAG
jgi:CRISPR-associated exonuclease Cas4